MTTAQRLQEARKAAGLSQHQLGALIGVSRAAVANWEVGYQPLPADRAFQIADICGADLTWLTCGASELSPAALKVVRGLERLPEEDRAKVIKMLEMMGWTP